MKIKEIESFAVKLKKYDKTPYWGAGYWAKDPMIHPGLPEDHPGDITTEYPPINRIRPVYSTKFETVVVKVTTDTGIIGWGEAHTPVAPEVAKAIVDNLLTPVLYGRDPLDIQPLWDLMYSTMRMRGHTSGFMLEAISGVDIALWDIAGKYLKVPVAKLMGGIIRDRIKVYASSLPRAHANAGEAGWQGLVDRAQGLVSEGYRAIKVKLGLDYDLDQYAMQFLRKAIGDEILLPVDVNGGYDLALAKKCGHMFERVGAFWLEEPLPPENIRDYTRLAEALTIKVVAGECLDNRWVFNDYFMAGAVDAINPDVSRAGGISESKRISDLADVYGIPYSPHVSIGTPIYMAASLQWSAAGPNFLMCEWPLDQGDEMKIMEGSFEFKDGYISLPNKPGLGIEVNEEELRNCI
jgi:D-galactarolactone cycloisomerase